MDCAEDNGGGGWGKIDLLGDKPKKIQPDMLNLQDYRRRVRAVQQHTAEQEVEQEKIMNNLQLLPIPYSDEQRTPSIQLDDHQAQEEQEEE